MPYIERMVIHYGISVAIKNDASKEYAITWEMFKWTKQGKLHLLYYFKHKEKNWE